ncbi:MAG: TonB-dependent receptor plug domain-containing protein, partial [Planctomycetota bacterium]
QGFSLSLNGGFFNRDGGTREADGNGKAYGGGLSWSDAPSDTLSYRISAGYYNSDPYSRPLGVQTLNHPLAGTIPCSGAPLTGCVPIGSHPQDSSIITGGAPYPVDSPDVPFGVGFANSGTSQPKLDLRIDKELSGGGQLSFSGGLAGTEGIVHTGIGPFDVQSGSYMYYGKVGFTKGAFKLQTFANLLDVEAPNLLLTDPLTLDPVQLNFKTQTFDVEIGHSAVVGGNHILSYGGNVRQNNFDISLTPEAEDRTEFGAYFQDEVHWDKFRLSVGGRVDKFGNIDDPVFSPRVTAMVKPTPDHSIRVSYNKAFRSPSAVNNYLAQPIFAPGIIIDLSPLAPLLPPPLDALVPAQPVPLIVNNVGNPDLREESLTAYEVAYTGTFGGRTTFGVACYQNDTNDNLNFVDVRPSASNPDGLPGLEYYTAADPPPGISGPLYGALVQLGIPNFPLPKTVSTYHNLGPIRQRGIEVSLDHRFNNQVSGFANYSFQDTPKVLEADADQIPYPTEEVGLPPRHRFNVGLNLSHDRFVGSAHFSYTDEAFWGDVLSTPFHGITDSFTMLNASFGVRWADGKVTTTLKGTNLTNATIQQHIFGDIIKRSLFAEVRVKFD